MLSRTEHLHGLGCMERSGRRENSGIHAWLCETLIQIEGPMPGIAILCHFRGGLLDTARLAQSENTDSHQGFSRMINPAAVFDAGT